MDDKKIRQNLQHKIRMQEQKLNNSNKNSQLSSAIDNNSDFLKRFSQLDMGMQDSYINNNNNQSFLMQNNSSQPSQASSSRTSQKRSSRQSTNKMQLQQRWHEIQQQQHKITTIQKDIDLYRREMLTLVANQQEMKQLRQTQRNKRQKQVQVLSLQHKLNIDKIKKQQEQKIEECLGKIQKLIVQKGEFNKDCEKFRLEEKKMDKLVKDQMERYKVDMKAVKEAFVSVEKDKRGKWEKLRVEVLKEQAITDTEPKILEIIKQSNAEIKNAEKKQAEMLEKYKRETKEKFEKELQLLQEKLFNQQEEQKEKLRVDESQKANVRYQEMERQFSSDRDKMREEYNKQVHELQVRVRQEISEFITRNKESHNDHLGEIKQLRENYEQRVKKMRENVRQRVEGEVVAVEKKHVARYEQSLGQFQQDNVRKYQKAEEKIRGEIDKRIEKIKVEVGQMKTDYQRQVDAEYDQKLYDQEQRQLAEKDSLQKAVQKLQQTVVTEQRKLAKQASRIRQSSSELQKLSLSNFTLQKRLTELQQQITTISTNEQSLQQKLKQHTKDVEQRLKQEYQVWRGKVLQLDDEKQAKQKELVEVYVQEQNRLDEELRAYREDIERNLEKRMAEIARVKDQLKVIEQRNEEKTRMLEEERKRLQ